MEKHLPDSIFVFKSNKLHCVDCIKNLKEFLLKRADIAVVDGDLEKKRVIIKGHIDIVTLIEKIDLKTSIDAELIYYKEGGWEDDDQPTERCEKKENDGFCASDRHEVKGTTGAKHHEKCNMFKDHDQKKESRRKKEKERSCADDQVEDIGADHYKVCKTFKDHKPEKYVPPKQEFFWGDFQSGMHKKFPSIPGAGSQFNAGYPNNHGLYYPAPWPQQDYM